MIRIQVLSKTVGVALINVCNMAPEANLYIVIAPIPKTTYLKRKEKGEINKLENVLIDRLKNNCSKINFIDVNKYRIFPDVAMRDSDHLRRPGWMAEYARLLEKIVIKLKLNSD